MLTWTRGALIILVCALATAPALATEKLFDKRLDAPAGSKFSLDTDIGAVVLIGGDARQVVVHAAIKGSEDFVERMTVSAVQGADGVTVSGRLARRSWFDWWFGLNRDQVLYRIELPQDDPVTVQTAGGSLEVRHVSAGVHGRTSGGSVTLRDLRGSIDIATSGGRIDAAQIHGPAQLRTSGGRIAVSDASGDLELRTSGGGIYLDRIEGKVQARTWGGGIEARMLANQGVSLVTAGGSITLLLPATARGSIDAHSSGGHAESAIAVSSTSAVRDTDLRGTINGGGEPIFLRTAGGSIHLGPLNQMCRR